MLIASLLLAGCASGVQSRHPLSSASLSTPDPRLEGIWRDKQNYWYITRLSHGDLLVLLPRHLGNSAIPAQTGCAPSDIYSATFFVTRTPKVNYLNVTQEYIHSLPDSLSAAGVPEAFGFRKYYFTKRGALIITDLEGEGFNNAVKQHKLRGKDNTGDLGTGPAIYLKDSGKRILQFIETSKPADIESGTVKLTRITGP